MIDYKDYTAISFLAESNKIERINKNPSNPEIKEYFRFMALEEVTVGDLIQFVNVFEPGAKIRNKPGMNVMVGNHLPMQGGRTIETTLVGILESLSEYSPYQNHLSYETLHPFTDCNGRSGRMLWAWQMGSFPLGFLHTFYYQALSQWN